MGFPHNIGRTRIRVARMLTEAGLEVDAGDLWLQRLRFGYDHARWGGVGHLQRGGERTPIRFYSWDTMGDVVRAGGVALSYSRRDGYEVFAADETVAKQYDSKGRGINAGDVLVAISPHLSGTPAPP